MDKVFRSIRILTVPPVFALALLVTAYCCLPGVFASPGELLGFILCLSVLPVLGYPLQRVLPHFREKGREGQRSLAMLFSAAGYLLGLAAALITHASRALLVIDLGKEQTVSAVEYLPQTGNHSTGGVKACTIYVYGK